MKRPSLLHRIKALSNHEKFVWLLLISTVILMIFFMICRFCGLSYFTNKYEEQSAETWMKELILFISSLFDYILIAMCLSRAKWYWCTLTGLLFNCLFFIPMPTWLPIVLDFGYMLFVGFILSRFDYKRVGYGLLLAVIVTLYQFVMMIGRYSIDLTARFNYMAMLVSVLDFKLFLVNIYLLVYLKRRKEDGRKQRVESSTSGC